MPPKRVLVETSSRSRGGSKGVFRQTYDTLTSAENAPVVRSIAVFGVCRMLAPTSSLACSSDYQIANYWDRSVSPSSPAPGPSTCCLRRSPFKSVSLSPEYSANNP